MDSTIFTRIPVVAATGKLDKTALPNYDAETTDDIINEGHPVTPTEITVATVWCKILQTRVVDIHENFFDLGG